MLDLEDFIVKQNTKQKPTSKQKPTRINLEYSVNNLVHRLYEDLLTLNWMHGILTNGKGAKKKNKKLEKALEKYIKSKE